MKKMRKLLIVAGLGLALPGIAMAEEWRLVKEQEGIRVYLKDVPGSKYSAYRGEVNIKTDLATLQALQDDAPGSCAWIHECREQKLLKREGDEGWTYTRFDTPWPVQPRDAVLHVKVHTEADGSAVREIEAVPDYLPAEDGFVRVSKTEGFWRMTPDGKGAVAVVYQLHAEPGGQVPGWLANKFVVEAPYNTLYQLRKAAEGR